MKLMNVGLINNPGGEKIMNYGYFSVFLFLLLLPSFSYSKKVTEYENLSVVINYSPSEIPIVDIITGIPLTIRLNGKEPIAAIEVGDTNLVAKKLLSFDGQMAYMVQVTALKKEGTTTLKLITDSGFIYVFVINVGGSEPTSVLYVNRFDGYLTTKSSPSGGFVFNSPDAVSKAGEYLRQIKNLDLSKVKFGFDRYSGNKSLLPYTVFSDGHFTYFQLSNSNDLDSAVIIPVVYQVIDGYDAMVPQHVSGGFLIVEAIGDRFTLRANSMFLCIARGLDLTRTFPMRQTPYGTDWVRGDKFQNEDKVRPDNEKNWIGKPAPKPKL